MVKLQTEVSGWIIINMQKRSMSGINKKMQRKTAEYLGLAIGLATNETNHYHDGVNLRKSKADSKRENWCELSDKQFGPVR